MLNNLNIFYKKKILIYGLGKSGLSVLKFLKKKKPDFLIMCAAKVGGILENKNYQLDFLLNNINIQNNLLLAAKKYNVKRTIFLGSSCIYPKKSKTPIKESYLMSGKLEKTNESYALSKIMGIKLSEILYEKYKKDIICLMPTNLYGKNDNFEVASSHVIPGLISKFLNAKKKKLDVEVWGSGKPIREFLHVDDLANACVYFMNKKTKHSIINIGTGKDYQIKYYADLMVKIILPNKKIFIKGLIFDSTNLLKQLTVNKFQEYTQKNQKGSIVKGKVIDKSPRILSIELEENVHGTLKLSELASDKSIDSMNIDDELDLIITNVDKKNQSISLSMKLLEKQNEDQALNDYNKHNESVGASLGDILKEQIDK